MLNKKTLQSVTLIAGLGFLASCSVIPPEAYYDHAAPESLLDQSSEVVNFAVGGDSSLQDMVAWINQDQPSRAELYCNEGEAACGEARRALQQFGVPVSFVPSTDNVATLIYDRVLARDCENRFIDNSLNPYNMLPPTYGCTVTSNMLQMVTDKRQFTSPALLEYQDGERLERVMDGYRQPYQDTQKTVDVNLKEASQSNLDSIGGN